VQEALGSHGYASPLHQHTREDEAFIVLDGELTVYVGNEIVRARAGSFLWAPRDMPHAYCVESDTARFLALSTSSTFDRFFFETGEPARTLTLPPPPDKAPDLQTLIHALDSYGVTVLGPPPAPQPKF
jgi:hypothetical protein